MTSLNTCLRSNCQVQAGGANGAVTFDRVTEGDQKHAEKARKNYQSGIVFEGFQQSLARIMVQMNLSGDIKMQSIM